MDARRRRRVSIPVASKLKFGEGSTAIYRIVEIRINRTVRLVISSYQYRLGIDGPGKVYFGR